MGDGRGGVLKGLIGPFLLVKFCHFVLMYFIFKKNRRRSGSHQCD